jgi:hypothetical protein
MFNIRTSLNINYAIICVEHARHYTKNDVIDIYIYVIYDVMTVYI